MAHLSAFTSPLCVNRSVGKLDQIDGVLNKMIEIFHWRELTRIELAGHPAVHDG